MTSRQLLGLTIAGLIVLMMVATLYHPADAATGNASGRYQFIATRSSDINTPRFWAMDTSDGQLYQLILPPRGARSWRKYYGPIR